MRMRLFYVLALTLAFSAGVSARTAWSQETVSPLPPITENYAAKDAGVDATPVAGTAANDDLLAQVAELRAAVDKLEQKAAADKKKAEGAPSVKVFGRLQWDWAAFNQNDASIAAAGDMKNGTEIRRGRIGVAGDAFQNIDYRLELEFAGQSSNMGSSTNPVYLQQTHFVDAYITFKTLPCLGNVRVGKFYECFGLETQTSDNYITLMERNFLSAAGRIGERKPGVMLFDWNESETMTWSVGAYAWMDDNAPPTFPLNTAYDDAGGTSGDTRITWLPWYDEESGGRSYLHFGGSYSYRDVAELQTGSTATRYSISVRPECHLANTVANTGNLVDAERMNVFSPEFVFTYGAFSIQGEYEWIALQRSSHDDPSFDGGYVQMSYFLTGEHRPYLRKEGVIGRVIPFENFFRVRTADGCMAKGMGAWEVAYRVSYIDLTDSGVTGGRVVDNTAGVNWYLNPFTRIMFNYVHSETTDRGAYERGIVDLVETRVAINF